MLKLKNTACVIICGLLSVGCTTTEKPESNSNVRDTVQSQPPESAEGETKTTQKTFSDSLIVEQPIFADTAKILLAGQFHEDEVWPGAGGEEWYGLSGPLYVLKSDDQVMEIDPEKNEEFKVDSIDLKWIRMITVLKGEDDILRGSWDMRYRFRNEG
jgi:hypothetical protein